MTKFLNISTDNTLGGSSASDEVVSSQKALKTYIDNHSGGGGSYTAGTGIDITSNTISVDFDEVATAAQGALADSAVQPEYLSAVATSGSYTDLNDKPTIPSMNSSNNYVPYRSSASAFSNSTLMYNSSAMAFTGKAHIGSSSPANYSNFGRLTIYDNTPNSQVSSLALLNYGGGGGCGVAIDMYNTNSNGGIPSGRFGVVDNGNYSGYLQLKVKKSGAYNNPLLTAMNVVPVPATNSATTCISFGQDEFNRVLFDLHKPEEYITISDSDKKWTGSGTTYYVSGNEKFATRLMVAVGDIVYFNAGTEATVTSVTSSSSQMQITTDVTLGSISNKSIYVKKAYMRISDENGNTKLAINPYGKMGIGTVSPAYDLDVVGNINASTDVKVNGSSVQNVIETVKVNGTALTPSSKAVDITVPTVNNATLTIQKNGTTVNTFTANASSNVTANITVPTQASDVGAVASNTAITGATKCKITYDSKGLVTAGADLGSGDITTALGYTPYNSTNPSGYQANVIETIKVNGTAQTVTSKAVDITVPTNNNQLTNGAGYITSSALSGYATETWVGQQGYLTGITSSNVTTALGYTPANDTGVVHLAGTETISGDKTFTGELLKSDTGANYPSITVKMSDYTRGNTPTANCQGRFRIVDSADNLLGQLYQRILTDGTRSIRIYSYNNDGSDQAWIEAGFNENGNKFTYAPACDINNSIVTTVAKNRASSGYYKLGNGLIIQWGRRTGNTGTVTLPTAFSSATSYSVGTTYNGSSSTDNMYALISDLTSTSFKIVAYSSSSICYWVAIGY